ncbi:hypothetical protein C8R44DRAFT_692597 [Mycena epipterygia]|nr:hypothetical protein C8R44DRAFT_692597 [Mycena epipterygia]
MSTTLSPPYSPPIDGVPTYSAAPGPDEHTLDHGSTSRGTRGSRTSAFVKMKANIGLEIHNQPQSILDPIVDGGSLISGNVLLEDTQSVATVEIQLDGWMECRTMGLGISTTRIVHETLSIYCGTPGTTCPTSLPFCHLFPSTFIQNNKSSPLPPSCDFEIKQGNFLKCKCSYSLSVIVTFSISRQSVATLFRKGKRMSVVLDFHQPLPYIPPIDNIFFMRTVKDCPEEWFQLPIPIPANDNSQFVTIICDLYLPRRSVFRITDTIPFHVQMSGSMDSLREVFIRRDVDQPKSGKSSPEAPVIRVFILRQVTVNIGTIVENNKRIILDEGLSASGPPAIQNWVQDSPHQSSSETLNWSGELRCQERRMVESFETANISISVRLTLSLFISHIHSLTLPFTGFHCDRGCSTELRILSTGSF